MTISEIEKIKENYILLKESVTGFEIETEKIKERLKKLENNKSEEYITILQELERKEINDDYFVKESFRDFSENSMIYVYMGMFRTSINIDIHRYSDEQVFDIEIADYLLYYNLDYNTIEKRIKPIDKNKFEKYNWVLKFSRVLLANPGYYKLQYEYHKSLLDGCLNEQKIFQKLKNNIIVSNNF